MDAEDVTHMMKELPPVEEELDDDDEDEEAPDEDEEDEDRCRDMHSALGNSRLSKGP